MDGQYAPVNFPYTKRVVTAKRGYGGIAVVSETADGKVNAKFTSYNRLQPLTGPFGNHNPPTADPNFVALNPQTNLAWTNTSKNYISSSNVLGHELVT